MEKNKLLGKSNLKEKLISQMKKPSYNKWHTHLGFSHGHTSDLDVSFDPAQLGRTGQIQDPRPNLGSQSK